MPVFARNLPWDVDGGVPEVLVALGPAAVPYVAPFAAGSAPAPEGWDADEWADTLAWNRDLALVTLAELGPAAAGHLDVFEAAAADPDPDLRGDAAEALGTLGTPAAAALLSGMRGDPDPDVRAAVAAALRSVPPTDAVRDALLALTRDPRASVRLPAAISLRSRFPDAPRAAPIEDRPEPGRPPRRDVGVSGTRPPIGGTRNRPAPRFDREPGATYCVRPARGDDKSSAWETDA